MRSSKMWPKNFNRCIVTQRPRPAFPQIAQSGFLILAAYFDMKIEGIGHGHETGKIGGGQMDAVRYITVAGIFARERAHRRECSLTHIKCSDTYRRANPLVKIKNGPVYAKIVNGEVNQPPGLRTVTDHIDAPFLCHFCNFSYWHHQAMLITDMSEQHQFYVRMLLERLLVRLKIVLFIAIGRKVYFGTFYLTVGAKPGHHVLISRIIGISPQDLIAR